MADGSQGNTAFYENMSATLLSQQPVTATDMTNKPAADWQIINSHLETRMNSMRSWRYSWWQHWSTLAEFFLPRRYHWVVVANKMWRGNPINNAIIDSTGTLAVNICASGMWTGLTSPSRPWFQLDIGLPWVQLDQDGKEWLEDTQERLYTVLEGSNFYTTMAQAFQDVTVFGTAPVITYEDHEDVLRCYLPCAGEYFLGVGARLSVDTLYREFTLTVLQIIDMFGVENCPPEIQNLWYEGGGTLETELVVAHAIEPNFAIAGKGKGAKNGKDEIRVVPGSFAYREVYWLKGRMTDRPLSMKGFHTKPFMAARWSTVSNDPYGRSPCMDALGDNKQIQVETRRKAEFIEKGVRPPMGADPSLKNEPSSIVPGMITYVNTGDGKKGFFPLFEPNPAWLPALTTDIKGVADRIDQCLFVDVFMAISRMEGVQPRNELELTKRDLERLQVLGPFVELFETEFAGPFIMRALDIMQRRRLLKPMPASLHGVPLKIEYTSIMKLAQRSAQTIAMKDVLATMGGLSSAAKAAGVPDPLRIFNLDKTGRKYAEISSFPSECIFTEAEVKQHDVAREQGKQQAQAPGQAMAAVTAAKTLSETQVPGGNALSAMLSGNVAQPGGGG